MSLTWYDCPKLLPAWLAVSGVPCQTNLSRRSWSRFPRQVFFSLYFSGRFAVFQDSLIQSLRREKEKYPSHYWRVWPIAQLVFSNPVRSCSPQLDTNQAKCCCSKSRAALRSNNACRTVHQVVPLHQKHPIVLTLYRPAHCPDHLDPLTEADYHDVAVITIVYLIRIFLGKNLMGEILLVRTVVVGGRHQRALWFLHRGNWGSMGDCRKVVGLVLRCVNLHHVPGLVVLGNEIQLQHLAITLLVRYHHLLKSVCLVRPPGEDLL